MKLLKSIGVTQLNLALVVGFNYFDNFWHNPSGEVAKLFDNKTIGRFRVLSYVLPVSLKTVRELLPRIIQRTQPSMVLGLGLAPLNKDLILELVAVNKAYFTKSDVNGYIAKYEDVLEGEPLIVHTTLPVEQIIKECTIKRNLPIRPGLGIGLYLCNTVAYIIMRYGVLNGIPAGFIHIPPSTVNLLRKESEHGMPLDYIYETVFCVIEVVAFEHT